MSGAGGVDGDGCVFVLVSMEGARVLSIDERRINWDEWVAADGPERERSHSLFCLLTVRQGN